jgi:hypothetical protein
MVGAVFKTKLLSKNEVPNIFILGDLGHPEVPLVADERPFLSDEFMAFGSWATGR